MASTKRSSREQTLVQNKPCYCSNPYIQKINQEFKFKEAKEHSTFFLREQDTTTWNWRLFLSILIPRFSTYLLIDSRWIIIGLEFSTGNFLVSSSVIKITNGVMNIILSTVCLYVFKKKKNSLFIRVHVMQTYIRNLLN